MSTYYNGYQDREWPGSEEDTGPVEGKGQIPMLPCPRCRESITPAELRTLWGRMTSAARTVKSGGRQGGRPGIPTTCPTCALLCGSKRAANSHCKAEKLTKRIEGYEAIAYAEANNLLLRKYADPTEDARDGLTLDEAWTIASEDARLIYIEVKG